MLGASFCKTLTHLATDLRQRRKYQRHFRANRHLGKREAEAKARVVFVVVEERDEQLRELAQPEREQYNRECQEAQSSREEKAKDERRRHVHDL